MKRLIYLPAAIILIAAMSCKKEIVNSNIDQNIELKIIGKWKFESLFFASTHTLYVAVPSQLDIVEFKADHKFSRSTNAEITQQGNYDIIQTKSVFTQKDDNLLRFNPQSIPAQETDIISIKGDTLTMLQNAYDGYVSKFSKVK